MPLKQFLCGLFLLALAACVAPEPTVTPTPPQSGHSAPWPADAPPGILSGPGVDPAQVAQCNAKGGRLMQAGMLGNFMCVIRYADAGKACSGKSDCQGRCYVDRKQGMIEMNRPSKGVCAADNVPFGCFQTVENGLAQPALCVD
jgi:hypothetical protein